MKHTLSTFWRQQVTSARRSPTVFALRITVILLAIALFITKRSFWTPDTLFLILLVISVVFGQVRPFLVRFVPFLGLLLVYDSFRSIATQLNSHVNYFPMIDFDRWMFGGHLPTVELQHLLWHGHLQWYDFYFYFLYTIHFLVPVVLAVVIWRFRDKLYWQYVWAIVGLSFAAFITYVLFPAAPPWLANVHHLIEPIHRISSDVWQAMGVNNFSEVYSNMSPNEVAAVPSLHSAYPLLFTLFIIRLFGIRRTWWVLIYPVSMWIGVVYLGEHYVFDVILGALYALGAYVAADRLFVWYNQPERLLRRKVDTFKARLAFWRS